MRRFYSFLLFLALLTLPVSSLRQGSQQTYLVFTNVAVIDATGSPVMPDMVVIISGDRITEIGRAGEVVVPEGAQLIDGSGKFLIPGLWDMHVHVLSRGRVERFFPLLVASGITGLRDMGGPPEELEYLNQWHKQVAEGTLLGPRFVASGPILDGPKPMFPDHSLAVGNEAEGRQAVNSLKARGAEPAREQVSKQKSDCLQYETTSDSLNSTKAESFSAFDLVAAMRRAGVEVMAGTDAPNPFILPGPSLHEELSMLVKAGFTPMESLQAATRNPARYLGMLDSLGTVEVGKIADLVLLEANPLEDISNTRRISAVVLRGRLIPKEELKVLESGALAAINNKSDVVKATRTAH